MTIMIWILFGTYATVGWKVAIVIGWLVEMCWLMRQQRKMLEKMETVDAPAMVSNLSKLRIADPPHSGHEIVRLEQAGLTYDNERWIFKGLDMNINRGDKIALVGYNGMGKTNYPSLQSPPHNYGTNRTPKRFYCKRSFCANTARDRGH